jgi:hypothetical protein
MNYQGLLGQNGVSSINIGVQCIFFRETKIQTLKQNNSLLEGNETVDLKLRRGHYSRCST